MWILASDSMRFNSTVCKFINIVDSRFVLQNTGMFWSYYPTGEIQELVQ